METIIGLRAHTSTQHTALIPAYRQTHTRNRQTNRYTKRQRDRQTSRLTDRQTYKQTDRQTDKQTHKQTDSKNRQRDRQSHKQTENRQTDRQAGRRLDSAPVSDVVALATKAKVVSAGRPKRIWCMWHTGRLMGDFVVK